MTSTVFNPFTLPNGSVLPNRIAKAAMEENMAGRGQLPDHALNTLYRRWADGGAGLLITGNVMVHAEAMTGPAGVVLDAQSPLEPFRAWADAAHSGGAKIWMQLNHPGRQVEAAMPGVAWGPSAVKVDVGRLSGRLATPSAMTAEQIDATVQRFATSARRAEEAGFDGIEVHAAHGYLLSQFLSPLSNLRDDQWGGSLENRARLLLDVVRAIRAEVAPEFAVSVKLNSADFQRGGFDEADAERVITWLAPLGVDLVELSGGSYESPAMTGNAPDSRTAQREAYFLALAEQLAATSPVPLMLTGGIVRLSVVEQVLASGVDVVGMGTALAMNPNLPKQWRSDATAAVEVSPVKTSNKVVASVLGMARVRHQLRRLGRGRSTRPGVNPKLAYAADAWRRRGALRRYTNWLETRRTAARRHPPAIHRVGRGHRAAAVKENDTGDSRR